MKKEINRKKAQVFEGVLSLIVNTVLFAAKLWVGVVSGSVALIADAWHTISDSLSSLFVIIAARLASKKADKEHPFGHGRWELVSAIIIACLLGFIGYEFLADSIDRFQNRESVSYGMLALAITIVSVVIKESLAQVAFYIGRKTNNPVVTADGWHHRTDSLSSVVILIGIIITRFFSGLWWMDSILGMLCALLIFFAAFQIMKETIAKILGEEPSQELIEQINSEIAKIYGNDLKTHHYHLHCYVSQKELTMHIMLDKDMSIEKGHEIATVIENMIATSFDIAATIHIEPL